MNEADYWKATYDMAAHEGPDALRVRKGPSTNWMEIAMVTNDRDNGGITIRSLPMAEILYAMLGQALGKNA